MPASVPLSWPPSNHPNATLYQLQYRLKGATSWINASLHPGPGTHAVVTGLTAGMIYEFRHIATNAVPWTEISLPTEIRAGVPPSAPVSIKVTR